jgi:hypothetical protein
MGPWRRAQKDRGKRWPERRAPARTHWQNFLGPRTARMSSLTRLTVIPPTVRGRRAEAIMARRRRPRPMNRPCCPADPIPPPPLALHARTSFL